MEPGEERATLSEEELDRIQRDLWNAIRSVNIQLIEEIIKKYQKHYDIINRPDKEGTRQSSIFLAVRLKDREAAVTITKLLLEHGGNPVFKDVHGETPLFYVAVEGKHELVTLFLEKGANLNEIDNFNQTPIFFACREGHLDTISVMYEHGVDIHHLDQQQDSCLFYASREGRADVVRFLIDKGININQVDASKQTALSLAKKKNHAKVVEMLTQAGAASAKPGRSIKPEQAAAASSNAGGAGVKKGTVGESKVSVSHHSASALRKRKKEGDKTRVPCRIVFTDKSGNSREITSEEWEKFKKDYPVVAGYLENPDTIPKDKLEEEASLEGWESVANSIMSNVWKIKGAIIFHKAVDPIRQGIPDYLNVIKEPMDFGTIKKKLSQNVYENIGEWISDMELVFNNCRTYNGTVSEVGQIGVNCQAEFSRFLEVYGVKDRYLKNGGSMASREANGASSNPGQAANDGDQIMTQE